MSKKHIHNKPKAATPLVTSTIINDSIALKKIQISLGIIIAVFAFALYAQSISYDYTLDDSMVIKENTVTQKGLAGIPEILTKYRLFGYHNGVLNAPEYRPASMILFAIEWQFFPDNPHVGHLINVLLFSLTCWILFQLLSKIFVKQSLLLPFICMLLFAAHPIHTEVVDNIKSLDEILCLLFGILSIYIFILAIESKSILKFVIGFLCFIICLMSKESGITFLIIIPLTLFLFTTSDKKQIINNTLLLAFVSGVFFLIRSKVLATTNAGIYDSSYNNSLLAAPDFISQKATEFYVLLQYILLLIFPHPLTTDYGYMQIPIQKISDITPILGIIIYLTIGIYSLINIRDKIVVSFAILFYLITLAPISNIFLMIGSPMAERFLYTPSIGFCLALSFLLIQIINNGNVKNKFLSVKEFFSMNSKLFLIVFIILGLYSIKTISRNIDWKNNISIYASDVKASDNSAKAHSSWGTTILMNIYPKENNPVMQKVLLDSAINEFNKAISIYPNMDKDYLELALAYQYKGDSIDAIKNYEKTMLFLKKPTNDIYRNLARLYQKTGQYEKAIALADTAIKYIADSNVYNNKGAALVGLGHYAEAIVAFQKALDVNSKDTMVYQNMGSAYGSLKQYPQALECFIKAYNLDSTDANNAYYIAMTYQNMGNIDRKSVV